VKASESASYLEDKHCFLTNFHKRSIRFKLGEYDGKERSAICRNAASSCTTVHFCYLALSNTSVRGMLTGKAASGMSQV
jgi:hypothetical protein